MGGNIIAHENSHGSYSPKPKYSQVSKLSSSASGDSPHIRANRGMVLMQDNATPHTARTTQQMIQGHNIRLLDWPPCSPDVNPIEHVWDEIDRRVRQLPQPQNLAELERDLINTWYNLPQRVLCNYVNSMRSSCLAVIRANGGHTRY